MVASALDDKSRFRNKYVPIPNQCGFTHTFFSKQMLFHSRNGKPSVVDNNSISSLPLPGLVVNIIALTLPQLQGKALLLPNYYVHTRNGIQDFPVPSTLSVQENIIWWILGQIWFPEQLHRVGGRVRTGTNLRHCGHTQRLFSQRELQQKFLAIQNDISLLTNPTLSLGTPGYFEDDRSTQYCTGMNAVSNVVFSSWYNKNFDSEYTEHSHSKLLK